jgi:hypothetical protein
VCAHRPPGARTQRGGVWNPARTLSATFVLKTHTEAGAGSRTRILGLEDQEEPRSTPAKRRSSCEKSGERGVMSHCSAPAFVVQRSIRRWRGALSSGSFGSVPFAWRIKDNRDQVGRGDPVARVENDRDLADLAGPQGRIAGGKQAPKVARLDKRKVSLDPLGGEGRRHASEEVLHQDPHPHLSTLPPRLPAEGRKATRA